MEEVILIKVIIREINPAGDDVQISVESLEIVNIFSRHDPTGTLIIVIEKLIVF